jgi:hypothetical protein
VEPTRYYFTSLLAERGEKAMHVCYAQWRERRKGDACMLYIVERGER